MFSEIEMMIDDATMEAIIHRVPFTVIGIRNGLIYIPSTEEIR